MKQARPITNLNGSRVHLLKFEAELNPAPNATTETLRFRATPFPDSQTATNHPTADAFRIAQRFPVVHSSPQMLGQESNTPTPSEIITRDPRRWPVTARQIVSRLPDEPDSLWQIRLHFDLGEFFIKLLGAWILNRSRENRNLRDSDVLREKVANLKKPPSLGHWLGLIDLAKSSEYAELQAVGSANLYSAISGLVQLRNRMAHQATPNRDTLARDLQTTQRLLAHILIEIEKVGLQFEYHPALSTPLQRPTWGQIYVRSDASKTDLFPWLFVLYENDEPNSLLIYDGFNKDVSYLGLGSANADLPPQAEKYARDVCNSIFEVEAAPIFFNQLIDSRSERTSTGSEYVTRTRLIDSVLKTFAEVPNEIVFLRGAPGSGKTSLCCQLIDHLEREQELDTSQIEVHHFCGRNAVDSVRPEEVVNNLTLQLRQRLGQHDSSKLLPALVESWLGKTANRLRIVIDGLDEFPYIPQLLSELRALKSAWSEASLNILISGQPKIESEVKATLQERVSILSIDGFQFEETMILSQKLELRNSGWTDHDTHRLLGHTSGLALYVHSFLRDVSTGDAGREDIKALPATLSGYWEQSIERAIQSAMSESELQAKKREANDLIGRIHSSRTDLIPKTTLEEFKRTSSEVIARYHSGDERIILLYVLASFPKALSIGQLREILGWESIDRVERTIKPFGSLTTQTADGAFCLYHSSIGDFLRLRSASADLTKRADKLILLWLEEWENDEFKSNAWLDFLPGWNRRLLDAKPDDRQESNADAVTEFLDRFDDFRWLQWVIARKGISTLRSIGLALLGDESLARVHLSLMCRPIPHQADRRIVQETLVRIDMLDAANEGDRELRKTEYVDEQDRVPLETLGGFTRADLNDFLKADEARKVSESERLETVMPEEWFTGRFDTCAALNEIRSSYSAALENFEAAENNRDSMRNLSHACDFLTEQQSAFSEMQRLDAVALREALAGSIVRSGFFEGTSLGSTSNAIIASGRCPYLRVNTNGIKTRRHGEWLYRPVEGGCAFATESPLLMVREEHGVSKDRHIEIYLFDWLKNQEIARLRFAEGEYVSILGLGHDGKQALLSVSGKMRLFSWDGEYRELQTPDGAECKSVNPDLRFIAIAIGKSYQIYDCLSDHVVEPSSIEVSERNGVRISENGHIAVCLDYRSFRLWTPGIANLRNSLWLPDGSYPDSKDKPYNFAISPNGRFFYLRGEIREISSGEVWRRIPEVEWNVQAVFSSDGRMLALMGRKGILLVFSVQEGLKIAHICCRAGCVVEPLSSPISFSPDGNFLLVRTWTEAFSVIDLRRSATPEEALSNEALLLETESEFIPVWSGREQLTISDRAAQPDNFGYFKTIDLLDGSGWTFGQKELLEADKINKDEETWEWLGVDCVGSNAYWLALPGFFLQEFDKIRFTTISTTCLIEQTERIDWNILCEVPDWHIRDNDVSSFEKLASRSWSLLCFAGGEEEEVIAGSYPNLLLHISLKNRKIINAKNTGNFEIYLEQFSHSGDVIAFPSHTQSQVGIWNYRTNTWIQRSLFPDEAAISPGFSRAVPFPWIGKIALICDWRGVFGCYDYRSDDLSIYERDQWIDASDLSAFSIPDTSLLLAVVKSSGINYEPTSGVCLVDPFSGEKLAHLFFETPIKTVVRIDATLFCVCFEDGSFEQVTVEGL